MLSRVFGRWLSWAENACSPWLYRALSPLLQLYEPVSMWAPAEVPFKKHFTDPKCMDLESVLAFTDFMRCKLPAVKWQRKREKSPPGRGWRSPPGFCSSHYYIGEPFSVDLLPSLPSELFFLWQDQLFLRSPETKCCSTTSNKNMLERLRSMPSELPDSLKDKQYPQAIPVHALIITF